MNNCRGISALGIVSAPAAIRLARWSRKLPMSMNIFLCALLLSSALASRASGQLPQSAAPASQSQSPPKKAESLADAARKAKAKKNTPGKVYTDEDLAGLQSGSVSVVGQDGHAPNSPSDATNATAGAKQNEAGGTGKNSETYWRGKAGKLHDQIAAADQETAKLKEEIKSSGGSGFDAASGLQQNVIYINDRNGRLKQLEGKKEKLQEQLNQLQEEGRKAGAPAGWFR